MVLVAHDHCVRFHADLGTSAEPVRQHRPEWVLNLVQRDAPAVHATEICNHKHHQTLIVRVQDDLNEDWLVVD